MGGEGLMLRWLVMGWLVLASLASAQDVLVPRGAAWKFRDDGVSLDREWRHVVYYDDVWKEGPAPIGYGETYIQTLADAGPADRPHITHYFRHKFEVADPRAYAALVLNLRRDDGAIVYINGREVLRSNMEPGLVDHTTLSVRIVYGEEELHYFTFPIVSTFLQAGENVVAVQVHQRDRTSSDLIFDAELLGITNVAQIRLSPNLDAWYSDYDSALGTAMLTRRPLFIYYYSNLHEGCRQVNQRVFAKETMNEILSLTVVRVAINVDDAATHHLAERDRVTRVPSVCIYGQGWPHPWRSMGTVEEKPLVEFLKSVGGWYQQ